MSSQSQSFTYTAGTQTFSLPSNLIQSSGISVTIAGGFGNGGGGVSAGAQITASFIMSQIATLLPLTVIVGSGGDYDNTHGNGGSGFSGGGAGGGDHSTLRSSSGGGSSALLTNTNVIVIEAGGGDGEPVSYSGGSLGGPQWVPGGTGGGYASSTPSGVPTVSGAGSGGSQGGTGGNGTTSNGAGYFQGGTHIGSPPTPLNGNNAVGAVSGAGQGSGGFPAFGPDTNNAAAGACFINSTFVASYSYGASSVGSFVTFTYHTADIPSPPTQQSPIGGAPVDSNGAGVTFSGTYVAPSPDTGALSAVALLVNYDGVHDLWWTGTALVSAVEVNSPTTITVANGSAAITTTSNFNTMGPGGTPLTAGMIVVGTNVASVPNGTTILSVNSNTSITLSNPVNAGGTTVGQSFNFSTPPPWIVPTTGVGATNGQPFTIVVPSGIIPDGHLVQWYLGTEESFFSLQSAFWYSPMKNATGASFQSVVAPTIAFSGPLGVVTTLTPTVAWTPTTPGGSQINYRYIIYATPQTMPAGLATPPTGALWDSTITAQSVSSGIPTSFVVPSAAGLTSGISSTSTYYGYLQIQETGSVPSAWVGGQFLVQLALASVPFLTATASTEPTTLIPAPLLTAGVNLNLLSAVDSSFESGVGSWSGGSHVASAVQSTAQSLDGTHSLLVTMDTSPGTNQWVNQNTHMVAQPNTVYTGVAWVYVPSGPQVFWLDVLTLDSTGSFIADHIGPNMKVFANHWTQIGVTFTSESNTGFVIMSVRLNTTVASQQFYVDQAAIFPNDISSNLLSLADQSFESGIGTWAVTSNCTIAQSSLAAFQGTKSLALTSITNSSMSAATAMYPIVAGNTYSAVANFISNSAGEQCFCFIDFYDTTGALVSSASSGNWLDVFLSFNEWTNAPVTANAPSNAAFASVRVFIASASSSETHLVDGVGLFPGNVSGYFGPWAVGGLQGIQTLDFQADYVGNGSWQDILTDFVGIVTGVSTTYDFGAPFNLALRYRVRAVALISGQGYVSAWSNVVILPGGVASSSWWIVPPTSLFSSMALARLPSSGAGSTTNVASPTAPAMPGQVGASIIIDEWEQQGVFRTFGKATATIVHGDIWNDEFDLDLFFSSAANFARFKAIRTLQGVVLVKSDMEGSIYWVTLGPDLNPGIMRETGRQSNPKRGLTVHCTPTDPYIPA